MSLIIPTEAMPWPLWRKLLFRFFFIFLLMQVVPWFAGLIPGSDYVTHFYTGPLDWLTELLNKHLFHVRDVLVPMNGSGDTSFGWAQLWTFLLIAFAGSLIWSVADSKRANYTKLNYWLCLVTRYFVATICFIYGFQKVLLLQMNFPSQSQLATPLGDFLPMRFSWMFIGYSGPYQFFSGLMECFAGLLLLYRRTATFGVMVAAGVFINVMMLNLSYDIPVKIFSMSMVVVCLFLLANEWNRIFCFFVMNKPASACDLYHFSYEHKRMRITRWILKTAFLVAVVFSFYQTYQYSLPGKTAAKPLVEGIYDVAVYAVNNDTIPALVSDTIRWQDIIFENGGGSVNSTDTSFRQRYHRGYFNFSSDTLKHTFEIRKSYGDSLPMIAFHYAKPDSSSINLWGKRGNDSMYVRLVKSKRHFQLAEKQFHWLSESNR